MAYDEELAERIRALLADRDDVVEKKMFGGLAFMVAGSMACGIIGKDLMARVGAELHEAALARKHARIMDFTGRPMRGFVRVEAPGTRTPRALEKWVAETVAFAASLAKQPQAKQGNAKQPQGAPSAAQFQGFPDGTLRFLRGLAKRNSKAWFEEHRADYDAFYVDAARKFIEAIGPGLRQIARGVQYEPRVNGSIFRIQRDVRFSKDKTPYKTHLDLWFWEGAHRGWESPGFFFRLTPTELILGAGMHQLGKQRLPAYRAAVLDERSGKALAKLAQQLREGGYRLGGATRKAVPRGFDPTHPRAALLLHEGLYAALEMPLPASLGTAGFVDTCLTHFRALAPVSTWLLEHTPPGTQHE